MAEILLTIQGHGVVGCADSIHKMVFVAVHSEVHTTSVKIFPFLELNPIFRGCVVLAEDCVSCIACINIEFLSRKIKEIAKYIGKP